MSRSKHVLQPLDGADHVVEEWLGGLLTNGDLRVESSVSTARAGNTTLRRWSRSPPSSEAAEDALVDLADQGALHLLDPLLKALWTWRCCRSGDPTARTA
jgi:hypothetical protein